MGGRVVRGDSAGVGRRTSDPPPAARTASRLTPPHGLHGSERGEGDAKELHVHYSGWKAKWDEWVAEGGGRVRAARCDSGRRGGGWFGAPPVEEEEGEEAEGEACRACGSSSWSAAHLPCARPSAATATSATTFSDAATNTTSSTAPTLLPRLLLFPLRSGRVAGNEMLLCDGYGCDAAYHLDCLRPPLLRIPKGSWHCPQARFGRSRPDLDLISALCSPPQHLR